MTTPPTDTPSPYVSLNRGNGVWMVRVYWPDTQQRVRLSLGVSLDYDPSEALEDFRTDALPHLIAEHRALQARAHAASSGNPDITVVVEWFLDVDCVHSGRAPKTIDHYARVLESFRTFCRTRKIARVQQIGWPLIQEWQNWTDAHRRQQGDAATAKREYIRALRYVFDQAAEAGVISERLNINWKIPAKSKESHFVSLSAPVVAEFFQRMRDHGRPIYDPTWFCMLTSWLPSDFLDLRLCEIHLDAGLIRRRRAKTGLQMPDQPINAEMRAVIERNIRGRDMRSDAHLFLDPKGHPWDYTTYKHRLQYFCQRWNEGVQVRPRDLRRTFGTMMARAGENPKVLQRLMAHEKVETTLEHYVDVDLDDLRGASDRLLGALTGASGSGVGPSATRIETTENPPQRRHTGE